MLFQVKTSNPAFERDSPEAGEPLNFTLAHTMTSDSTLQEIGLTEGLINYLSTFDKSSVLAFRCQKHFYCLTSPIIKRSIVPLWECGTVLTYFNKVSGQFEQCSLEDISEVWFHYNSVQSLLAHLFIDLYEDEVTIEELHTIARQVGFKHFGNFISELQNNLGEKYEIWKNSFPSACVG
jgi:hypothetical protein